MRLRGAGVKVLETNTLFHGIAEDTIKANGIPIIKEKHTVKSLVLKNSRRGLLAPPDATLDGTGSGTIYNGNPVFRK
jgi:hypothetical protein